jgi:glucan biosynthesis protein C
LPLNQELIVVMKDKTVRSPWIDNLRGFITLLVVAHHSSLAYTTFAYFDKTAYNHSTHPIVDVARWKGLDIFEDFNDIFFMSLMFLISGIFVVNSLKKGTVLFIRERFYRLFIPFLVGVTLLMLLAYYPAYLLAYGKNDVKAYIIDFFTVESWPVGPPWFIWILFLFNLIFALLYPALKSGIYRLGTLLNNQKIDSFKIILSLYLISWILHIPLLLWAGPGSWTGIGPFDFQISRILLYFGYFIIGILIGSVPLNTGIFAGESDLALKWPMWCLASIGIYTALKLSEAPLIQCITTGQLTRLSAEILYRSLWILSCVFSCLAFLTLFKRFFSYTNHIWESLSANAYGIYLIHYIFVLWCQYLLLNTDLHAFAKFLITFLASVSLSWFSAVCLRRLKMIGKYL